MSTDDERRPIELTPQEFWEKWGPKEGTAKTRGDYMVDLERLVLTRISERAREVKPAATRAERASRAVPEQAERTQSGRFTWSDEHVVVKRVDPIAIYKNAEGDIVVRQERQRGEDAIIVVPARYAYSVLEALQRELKGPMFTVPPSPPDVGGA
jgi:hypothetical protein